MFDTFIDPGYTPPQRPIPPSVTAAATPTQPSGPSPLGLGDLYRLIPENGWNWILLGLLWNKREESIGVWRLVNKMADDFKPKDRYHKRQVRTSIWKDLTTLTQQGWVVRQGGKIQLNMRRLTGNYGV